MQALSAAVRGGELSAPPVNTRVPGWLRPIIARGLAVSPEERWPSMDELLAALARDPTRRRWLLGGAALSVVAVVGSLFIVAAQSRQRAASCEARATEVDAVWSQAAREELRRGLAGTGVSFAETMATSVIASLDAYAASWQRARAEVCRAASIERRWAPELAARADTCLDEHLVQARALVSGLSRPKPGPAGAGVAQQALIAATSLPRNEPCLDARHLAKRPRLPEDEAARDAYIEQRARLAEAVALEAVGEYERAAELVGRVNEQAEARGWASLRAGALWQRGRLRGKLGEFEEAEEALEAAFFLATRSLPDVDHAMMAADLAGLVGGKLERHAEGERWAALALALLERAGAPDDDLMYADALTSQGVVWFRQGKLEDALASFERALAIKARVDGDDHPSLANSLARLGPVYASMGRYDEALEAQTRALTILRETMGADHPMAISALINLGNVHQVQGNFDGAARAHERAAESIERTLGPSHPRLARALTNLANAYGSQGRSADAIELFQRVIAILEAKLGPEHIRVARALANMGTAYEEMGAYDDAMRANRRALKIYEQTTGGEDADAGMALHNIGSIHGAQGAYAEAIEALARALAIRERALGTEHPSVAETLNNLGAARLALGAQDEALAAHERALAINEEALGASHPAVARTRYYLGELYRARGEHGAARDAHARALAIYEEALGGEHPLVALSLAALGELALERGRLAVARARLERAALIYGAHPASATEAAAASFALARAIWPEEQQRARARDLAERARDGYRGAGDGFTAERAEVEAWLIERGARD